MCRFLVAIVHRAFLPVFGNSDSHFTWHGQPGSCQPYERVEVVRKEDGKYVKRWVDDYRWSWHSLRHLFCSLAISNDEYGYGLDAAEGAKLAGHTLDVFMKLYVQVPQDFAEKTARQMANVPAPPVGPRNRTPTA